MAGDTRMEWTTRAITIRATRMDVAKFSSDIPTSRAAGIAPGIPHTEAAGAASRTSYPQAAPASCIASRLTRPGFGGGYSPPQLRRGQRSEAKLGCVGQSIDFVEQHHPPPSIEASPCRARPSVRLPSSTEEGSFPPCQFIRIFIHSAYSLFLPGAASLSLGSAFLTRYFRTRLTSLGQSDSDGLLAALHSLSALAALQSPSFAFMHRLLNFLRCFLAVSGHCLTPSSLACTMIARRDIVDWKSTRLNSSH